jgi:hypothetical protein
MRFPDDVVFAFGALLTASDFILKFRPLLTRDKVADEVRQ